MISREISISPLCFDCIIAYDNYDSSINNADYRYIYYFGISLTIIFLLYISDTLINLTNRIHAERIWFLPRKLIDTILYWHIRFVISTQFFDARLFSTYHHSSIPVRIIWSINCYSLYLWARSYKMLVVNHIPVSRPKIFIT